MAVTTHVYTKASHSLAAKLANIGTDALKVALLSSYTIGTSQQTAQFYSDVVTGGVGVETSGTGYTAGGLALTSVTLTDSGLVTTLSSANPSWNATGGSLAAAYALFYDSTPGTVSTNPVLFYWDFGGTVTATSSTFTLTVSASGLLTFTAV